MIIKTGIKTVNEFKLMHVDIHVFTAGQKSCGK